MRSYQVRFGKKEEDCAQISALDLYKLIDHVVGPTHTKKLVPLTDSKSAFADVKMIDNQILMELKKNICCDLKLVWDLPKDSRNKAVKRLYLNYHPDKAEPKRRKFMMMLSSSCSNKLRIWMLAEGYWVYLCLSIFSSVFLCTYF